MLDNCVKKIKKILKNEQNDLIKGINYIILDGEEVKNIIDDIETPAFGFSKKLIIAKNTGLFKKETKKKSGEIEILREKIKTYLSENFSQIEETVNIIFIEEDAEKNSLLDFIDKNGIVCKFTELKPIDIKKRLKAICNGYKVNVDEKTLDYFIECCGTNFQELINEIRKLIEYAGENGTVTKESIDNLAIKKIESIIFDLTDSLGQKDIKKALEVLNNLIFEKEPIQKILITLYNHFKKLLIVKLAVNYNKDIAQSLKLKPNQMFLVNKYKNQARLFKLEELQIINQELIDLDFKYKNGLVDLQVGLEAILCAYI
ncbi:MAG: DNA polymerase III subunit delta [Clostridia bacterium]|nr:DNA polymerase III subunit delta [Clostridia bacterium]